jgi:hypothetical protein
MDQLVETILTDFTKILEKRMAQNPEFVEKSQEAVMSFFLAYAIASVKVELLTSLYVEYPLGNKVGSRDKIDLFIPKNKGYYFEIKYNRPIPSGATRPLPKHRGMLINDAVKLITLVPLEAKKFLILISDENFVKHLRKKQGFGLKEKWSGKIKDLITCATEANEIKFKIPNQMVSINNRFTANAGPLQIMLFEII